MLWILLVGEYEVVGTYELVLYLVPTCVLIILISNSTTSLVLLASNNIDSTLVENKIDATRMRLVCIQ